MTQITPESQPASLERAMLSLLQCLTDDRRAATAFAAIGSWLDEDADPLRLAALEEYSGHILENALLAHLTEPVEEDVRFIACEASDEELAALRDRVAPDDRARLDQLAAPDAGDGEVLLRLPQPNGGATLLCHVARADDVLEVREERRTLLETTETALCANFRLSDAELLVVRGLVLGERPRDIAERLGKSYETVRSQIKSIGDKLGASTHGEIVSAARAADAMMARAARKPASACEARRRLVRTADDRVVEYDVFGAEAGTTLLYFHDFLGGRHWPAVAEAEARGRGYRVISPSRAGFGRSSPVRRGGPWALTSHVADYAAVIAAESTGSIAIFAEGSGMSAAYSFALANPDAVTRIVGLNAMPPIEGRWTIPHCAPGVFRNGALAALYAPKTIRLLGKLGMKRIASSNSRQVFGEVMSTDPDLIAETDADFDAYMKDNLSDSVVAGADGVAVDCTYMAHDWARSDERLNSRPEVRLLINRDFPFIADPPAERFSAQIGATLSKIETGYARRLFDLSRVFDALEAA